MSEIACIAESSHRSNKVAPSGSLVQGKTSNSVSGWPFMIPAPPEIATMPDYQEVMSRCQSARDVGCRDAMNQFVSDSVLMAPDTMNFMAEYMLQTNELRKRVNERQNALNELGARISRVRIQLVGASNGWDSQEADYAQSASNLASSVREIVSPHGNAIYDFANNEKQVMADKITATAAAASAYVTALAANSRDVANKVSLLYKNDRNVVGATFASRLAAVSNTISRVVADTDNAQRWWNANVTGQQNQLQESSAAVAKAKLDALAKAQSVQNSVKVAVADATGPPMSQVQSDFDAEVNTAAKLAADTLSEGYKSVDAAASAAGLADDSATTSFLSNLDSVQTQMESLQSVISDRAAGANAAVSAARSSVDSRVNANAEKVSRSMGVMNKTMDAYLNTNSQVSSKTFANSQNYMQQFATLANDAAAGLPGAAVRDAEHLSGLNGYIGTIATSSTSAENARDVSRSLGNSQQFAALSNVGQVLAIADAITVITTLFELVKAKSAKGSDKADVQLSAIQNSLQYSRDALQETLEEIVGSVSDKVKRTAQEAKEKLEVLVASAKDDGREKEGQLSAARRAADAQLAASTSRSAQAAAAADLVVTSGAELAKEVASSNDVLSTQVAGMKSNVARTWKDVNSKLNELNTQINAGTKAAAGAASSLLAAEQARTSNLVTTSKSGVQTVVATATTAVQAAATAAADAYASDANMIIQRLTKSSADVGALMGVAKTVTAQVSSSLGLVPKVLSTSGTAQVVSIENAMKNFLKAGQAAIATEEKTEQAMIASAISESRSTVLNTVAAKVTQLSAQISAKRKEVDSITQSKVLSTDSLDTVLKRNVFVGMKEVQFSDESSKISSLLRTMEIPSASIPIASALTGVAEVVNTGISELSKLRQNETIRPKYVYPKDYEEFLGAQRKSTNLAVTQVTAVSDTEKRKQEILAKALDGIIKGMINSSGHNSEDLKALQTQLGQLQKSSFGLSASLNAALTRGVSEIDKRSVQATNQVSAKIVKTEKETLSKFTSLADQLFSATKSETDSDPNLAILAAALKSLSTDAQTKIRDVVARIAAGEMTVNDVLLANSKVDFAKLGTSEDLILAGAKYTKALLLRMKLLYTKDVARMEGFKEAALSSMNRANRTRIESLAAARELLESVSLKAPVFVSSISKLRQDRASLESTLVAAALRLRRQVVKSVEAAERAQDIVASKLISAQKNTKSSLLERIPKGSNLRSLDLPTIPPWITL